MSPSTRGWRGQGTPVTPRRAPQFTQRDTTIYTTADLIARDDLEHPGSLYDLEPGWRRVDEARDRRRAEQMAAENSRPQLHHVLEVLPVDRKKAA